jgi:long-chain acyl-CoA synthetase
MAESLAEFFLHHFRVHAHEYAYRQRRGYRIESFTYGQVMQMASQVTRFLHDHGIAKGDRIILCGQNSAEWVAAFFGCALSGVVVVPMDAGASPDFAMRVFRQVDGKLLIASQKHLADNVVGDLPTLAFEVLTPSNADSSPLSAVALNGSDVLQIVFTSGTTADPRGVVITHANVLANIAPLEREMRRYLKYERLVHPLRFLNLLPLSHVFGQFLGMFLPPLLGATVILQDELKPSEIVDTIRRERVSVLVCVPRVLQSLKQKIERDIEDRGGSANFRKRFIDSKDQHFLRRWWTFRSIRRQFGWKFWAFICGGATLDSETEEFWQRLGYAAIQGYGLTETTSLVSVNHPFKLGKGSIGKVLPGREVKLAEDGEILVRGAGVASGYWGNASQDVSDAEGWYRTGDVGARDEAGNLYFKGRKKEVIVTPGGTNVYPEDLEAALRAQPEVHDCVVVGIDRGGNAEPCAVVILGSDDNAEEKQLEKIVRNANQSLAEYQRMNMWMEWPQPDFPRTSTQKPKRNLIAETVRQQISQGDSKSEGSANSPLSELIARVAGRPPIRLREDSSLDSDLGLSSLDRVELIGALEDRYQLDLSEARFTAVKTVGDLERMLRGETTPSAAYHYPNWVLRWPTTWLRWLAHYLLLRPAVIVLGWPRIEGREHLRGVNGPLLIICNHLADIDPGFVLTALPARFRNRLAVATGGEALEALRTPPYGRYFFLRIYDRVKWILGVSLLNLFPLPREAGFRRSFAYAGEAVDRGYSVLVFPEGRHTTDGKMNPFRAGIGLLANNLGIPVLPVRIHGLFEIKQSGKKFAPPGRICVCIGKPRVFPPKSKPEEIARDLQRAVESL